MADSFWEDAGEEILTAVAEAALSSAISNAFGGDKRQNTSQIVAIQEPVGAALIWVGGWSRNAGDTVFHEPQPDNISRFWSVQALADHRLETRDIYLNSDIALFGDGDGWVTDVQLLANRDGRYNDNKVRILTREGLETETPYQYPYNLGGDHDSDLISSFPDMLDSSFRGDGTASIMMLTILPTKGFRIQAFPNGRPDLSVEGRSKAIYDWRDPTQARLDPETWMPCHNPVVNLVHLEWFRWGREWGDIWSVLPELTEEADYCDEPVELAAGGTEPRYEVAFAYRDDETRDSVRDRIKRSMDGFITTDGLGRPVIRAGRYDAPTFIIPGEFVSIGTWGAGVDPDDQYDRYEIEYTNPAALYNKDQANPLILRDGTRSDTLDFTPCTSWTQAERLAVREPPKRMPDYSGTVSVGDYGIAWFLPDTDGKRCPRYIMIDKPEVPSIHMVPLEVNEAVDDFWGDGFTFDLRTANPNIDVWVPATQEGPPPADPMLK